MGCITPVLAAEISCRHRTAERDKLSRVMELTAESGMNTEEIFTERMDLPPTRPEEVPLRNEKTAAEATKCSSK